MTELSFVLLRGMQSVVWLKCYFTTYAKYFPLVEDPRPTLMEPVAFDLVIDQHSPNQLLLMFTFFNLFLSVSFSIIGYLLYFITSLLNSCLYLLYVCYICL